MTARQRILKARLRELEDVNGLLLPERVVEAAKDPNDVLHAEFEWDDAKAAHAHRIEQARELIRSVKYTESVVDVPFKVPGNYVNVTLPSSERGYMPLDSVRTDVYLARQTLTREIGFCVSALERARSVADIIGVREDLEQALSHLLALRAKAA